MASVSLTSRYNVTVYQRVPSMCEYHVTCRYVWNARRRETLRGKTQPRHSIAILGVNDIVYSMEYVG